MLWARFIGFVGLLAAAALAYVLPAMVPDERDALQCGAPEASRTAVLAVGDVGRPAGYTGLFDTQLAVAAAMDFEHRELPADALLLLGDNFYPRGLAREEMATRISQNIVRPYCRFVELSGSRAAQVAGACALSSELRNPIPIVAVLGNHDTMQPESAALQRRNVSAFVSNWRMARDLADVLELPGGLSVIHFDSVGLRAGEDVAALVDALRASRGPWRVLAAHHPLLEPGVAQEDGYRDALVKAIESAGVRVHVLLTGHEHNLQIGVTGLERLPLQVIAGSGAGARPTRSQILGQQFIAFRPGYARVDLERGSRGERLVVSLSSTARYPFQFWQTRRVETCWSVSVEGEVSAAGSRPAAADATVVQ